MSISSAYTCVYILPNNVVNDLLTTLSVIINLRKNKNNKQFIAGGDGSGSGGVCVCVAGGRHTQTSRVQRSNAFRSWHSTTTSSTCAHSFFRTRTCRKMYNFRRVGLLMHGDAWMEPQILISCLLLFPWAALTSPRGCCYNTQVTFSLLGLLSYHGFKRKKKRFPVIQHSVC